ncbi:MAG: YggS family pyridoxal phosphate-dependent enzyme [Clostridia bacterium]|nr:YggS family pyridoxal phosphate-dependent enzyme [Clostridia bacterium]
MYGRDEIRKNITRILSELNGRAELLAATKTIPADIINYALECGVRTIGENRADELLEKYDAIRKEGIEIHFIGHLQRNKVKKIIDKVSMIHSLDSYELACEIEKQAAERGLRMRVLIEINLASEPSKSGLPIEEVRPFLDRIRPLTHLIPSGLMAVPPKTDDPEDNRKLFEKISQLFIDILHKNEDNREWRYLSLGMSGDYLPAVECGSNLVRIGSAIFGPRT